MKIFVICFGGLDLVMFVYKVVKECELVGFLLFDYG